MGQIANQMALEIIFYVKERIKEKKKQNKNNKNNGFKEIDNPQFVGNKQLRQFYNKTALEHLCVKSMNALFLCIYGQRTRKAAFGQVVQKFK